MTDQLDGKRRAKADGFLRIVQTGLLAIAGARRRADRGLKAVAEYSGTGVFMHMDEAVRAAGRIPDAMSILEAAAAFCRFYAADRNGPRDLPHWFARYGAEDHDYAAVSKAEQFVWIIQTSLLANAENLAVHGIAGHDEPAATYEAMAEAVRVAPQIPAATNSTEAAADFLAFYEPGMKERRSRPKWCAVEASRWGD